MIVFKENVPIKTMQIDAYIEIDTFNKVISTNAINMKVLYALLKDAWASKGDLRKYRFPLYDETEWAFQFRDMSVFL